MNGKESAKESKTADNMAYVPQRRSKKLNRYSTGEDVLRKYSINRAGGRSNSSEDLRVEGFRNKNCIITGGSSGLGLETVKMMLLGGARRIYVCCRNTTAAATGLNLSTAIADDRVVIVKLDLLSLHSIKHCADEILEREIGSTIDIVVCNAGTLQPKFLVNENGWEYQMATNYMGHFYLVNLLLPKMKAQPSNSRIVVVSSRYHANARLDINDLHFSSSGGSSSRSNNNNTSSSSSSSNQSSQPHRYCPRIAYANSKLATILFIRALAQRLEDTQVIAVALHPGRVSTSFRKHFIPEEGFRSLIFKTFFADKSIPQGVATTIYVCVAPEIARMSGSFFDNCARADDYLSEDAQDHTGLLRECLWRETRLQIKKEILKMAMAETLSAVSLPPPPHSSSTTHTVTFILPENYVSDNTSSAADICFSSIDDITDDSNNDSNKV